MNKRLKDLTLPRLKSLTIKYPFEFEDPDALYGPDSILHFYSSWSVPKLRYLRAENFIPSVFPLPALTSLTISLRRANDDEGHSPCRLRNFLSSLPQLEDLHLILGTRFHKERIPKLVLRNLKSFRIVVMHWVAPEVSALLKALVTPWIRSKHLKIERYFEAEWEGLSNWLKVLLCHDDYPIMEELTFEFFDHKKLSKYRVPFEKLPNLRALTLDTLDWHPSLTRSDSQYGCIPPLRSLRLKGSDYRWALWLKRIHARMNAGKQLAQFQNLSIDLAESWDKEHVEKLFEGRRITWGVGNAHSRVEEFQ